MDIHRNPRLTLRSRASAGSQLASAPQSPLVSRQPRQPCRRAAPRECARLGDSAQCRYESTLGQPYPACALLTRWRDLNPPPLIQRYEYPVPGDLVHLDIKGITRSSEVILRGDGCLRGNGCLRGKQKHPGFMALRSALEFFARYGVGVRALLTDNGSSYRSSQFRQACQQLQLKHYRTGFYTPRTKGNAEDFVQTALRERAYANHWLNSDQRD